MFKIIILISFSILLSACSFIPFSGKNTDSKVEIKLEGYSKNHTKDYVDHLSNFEKTYFNDPKIKKIKFSKRQKKYITGIIDNIVKKNELFFKSSVKSKINIIRDDVPFHFSLPGRNIFISSGLINKYIKNEKILYCLIAYELIRSEKYIYRKVFIVPTGIIKTSRMLSLLRLSIDEKVEIHKWAFYILKRVGIDTDNYLSWLQIQNRNSVDFSLQLGDVRSISREESLFKAFIIKNANKKVKNKKYEGSSKSFYSFVNKLKG